MLVPLVILALLSVTTGWLPFSELVSSDAVPYALGINWWIAAGGILVSLAGIAVATRLYCRANDLPARLAAKWAGFWRAASHRFLHRPGLAVCDQEDHLPLRQHAGGVV